MPMVAMTMSRIPELCRQVSFRRISSPMRRKIYAAVMGAATTHGHDSVIAMPNQPNEMITLQHVAPSSLHASNFQFA